jgi:hypothetical protein
LPSAADRVGMTEPEQTLRDSPVDFDSAIAFALQPVMRRLIIVYVVGALLLPFGLSTFLSRTAAAGLIGRLFGLAVAVAGATLLFAGLVGAAFKIVADANLLAKQA